SRAKIKLYIATYQFMLEQKDNTQDRWSYYYEYLKNPKVRKARKQFSYFDYVLVEKIKNTEMTAQDLRDKLPVICDSKKTLRKMLGEEITFEDAFEEAENSGVSTSAFKRLEKFRKWLATDQAQHQIVHAKGQAADKIKFEVRKIGSFVRKLKEQFGDS